MEAALGDVAALESGTDPKNGSRSVSRVRLSPEEIDLIDKVRGDESRGEWIRRAVLWAADKYRDLPPLAGLDIPLRSKGTDRTSVAFRIKDIDLVKIDASRSTMPRDGWIRDAAVRVASGILKARWAL